MTKAKVMLRTDPENLIKALEAFSFAARAHEGQYRRDEKTPYASHVFRVAFILRHVFGETDERMIAAAVLHDTLEDTTTDFDELSKHFGAEIAGWVACLSKDMRMEEALREKAYRAQLHRAPEKVKIIKLADLYDNITDTSVKKLSEVISKADRHLDNLKKNASGKLRKSIRVVENLIDARTKEIEN